MLKSYQQVLSNLNSSLDTVEHCTGVWQPGHVLGIYIYIRYCVPGVLLMGGVGASRV